MEKENALYLIEPGPRPPFGELADHLFGIDADVDTDGNSMRADDMLWTELSVALRSDGENARVCVDPVCEQPLVLEVRSPRAELAQRAAAFLQLRCGGGIAEAWPVG